MDIMISQSGVRSLSREPESGAGVRSDSRLPSPASPESHQHLCLRQVFAAAQQLRVATAACFTECNILRSSSGDAVKYEQPSWTHYPPLLESTSPSLLSSSLFCVSSRLFASPFVGRTHRHEGRRSRGTRGRLVCRSRRETKKRRRETSCCLTGKVKRCS